VNDLTEKQPAGARSRTTRLPVRIRLTLVYTATFVVAGAGLLAISYALLRNELPHSKVTVQSKQTPSEWAKATLLDPKATPKAKSLARELIAADPRTAKALAASSQLFVNGHAATAKQVVETVNNSALSRLITEGAIALAIMAVVSAAGGWVIAGRALRPVREMTDAVREMSPDDLSQRLTIDGPDDEVTRLAATFDDLLDRLDQAVSSQQRFVANASHELRTPLTIMRTELDVTLRDPDAGVDEYRAMAAVLRNAVGRSERLVESLLDLAAGERAHLATEPIDLANVVTAGVADLASEAAAASITVTATTSSAITIGDPDLIARAVQNLLENAVRHNQPGGDVDVRTETDERFAVLQVANSGASIDETRIAGLFEPFQKGDATRLRGGIGLGLSIVATVVTAHHGEVRASPRDGGGLVVTIQLPAAAAD
jgi:signal transduction histidine kinase